MKKAANRQPTHPGAVLREDVISELGISVSALAKDLRISRQTLHGILRESKPVTVNIALRLGKFLGNGPGLWLRMQETYDLWQIEKAIGPELDKIEQYQAA